MDVQFREGRKELDEVAARVRTAASFLPTAIRSPSTIRPPADGADDRVPVSPLMEAV
jgi:hypothetical protein